MPNRTRAEREERAMLSARDLIRDYWHAHQLPLAQRHVLHRVQMLLYRIDPMLTWPTVRDVAVSKGYIAFLITSQCSTYYLPGEVWNEKSAEEQLIYRMEIEKWARWRRRQGARSPFTGKRDAKPMVRRVKNDETGTALSFIQSSPMSAFLDD